MLTKKKDGKTHYRFQPYFGKDEHGNVVRQHVRDMHRKLPIVSRLLAFSIMLKRMAIGYVYTPLRTKPLYT